LDFTSHIYPADSILRAVHLVVPPGYPDWKPLKLLDLEFANSIEMSWHKSRRLAESSRLVWHPVWYVKPAHRGSH